MTRPSVAVSLALAVVTSGCTAKVLTPSPADRLREENAGLETTVANLELELAEAETRIASLVEAEENRAGVARDPEVLAATPHLARIDIAGSSGLEIDRSGRGTLFVRLVPRDGRGRFLQIVGRVSIRASVLAEESTPALVGERSFGPIEVRNAWRSGFGGSVYLFEVPVEVPAALRDAPDATVLAILRDAIGGGEYSRIGLVRMEIRDGSERTSEGESS